MWMVGAVTSSLGEAFTVPHTHAVQCFLLARIYWRFFVLAVENCQGWFSTACAMGSKEQVHYSAWQYGMKQQSPDVGKTQLWTPHLHNSRLHTLLPHSHFPNRSGAAQGLARRCLWSSAGDGGSEGHGCQRPTSTPSGCFLSRDSLFQSHRRHSSLAAVASTVKGKEWVWSWKTFRLFSYHRTDTNNQFFMFVFRGSASFCLFGVCRNKRGITLILYRKVRCQSSWFAFSNTKLQTCSESFFEPVRMLVRELHIHPQSIPIGEHVVPQRANDAVETKC